MTGSPTVCALDPRADERLTLASVLQELTVAALELFDPTRSADTLLERIAERLGCYAAVFMEVVDGAGALMGASGIGAASRTLPLSSDAVCAAIAGRDAPPLPYPELAGRELHRWHFRVEAANHAPAGLVLYFHCEPDGCDLALPAQYRGMVERLARILGIVLAHRDLFARTRASEHRLEAQRVMLEEIGEASSMGILVTDGPDHELLFVNRRFTEMWGLDPELACASREAVHAAAAARTVDPDAYLDRAGYIALHPDLEAFDEVRLTDGRVFVRRAAPVRSRAGVRYGQGLYFVDITDRKRSEAERERLLETERAARAAAEEAIRVRDEFLSIASHELRTPLASMRLVVQVLRAGFERGTAVTPEIGTKLLESIERQTDRLSRLTTDLLDVSRLAAGRLSLQREQVDLLALCDEVIARFREELARSGSTITLRSTEAPVGCWDRSRIDQVITNLLSNAIKYGEGHPIEVEVRGGEHAARLAVRDHGIGIAPENFGRLFDRFERCVSPRNYGGLGLGLFIVKEIVEMHGGRITVTSALGEGSTFSVELPRDGRA